MSLEVLQIPVLADNYIYLLREPAHGVVGVVDPGAVTPVLSEVQRRGLKIDYILNTHHHLDHVGGNLELKWLSGCKIVGPEADRLRIPGIDVPVKDGDRLPFGATSAEVIFVPGHTHNHIAYWFADDDALFCGDTLFSVGCGRLFEGTPEQMWNSLSRLKSLPPQTRIYCAHEYTQSNVRFAVSIDPRNLELRSRESAVSAAREKGQPTVPSLLAEELAVNPFLRADNRALQEALHMEGSSPSEVFAAIRKLKDNFRVA